MARERTGKEKARFEKNGGKGKSLIFIVVFFVFVLATYYLIQILRLLSRKI